MEYAQDSPGFKDFFFNYLNCFKSYGTKKRNDEVSRSERPEISTRR